MKKIVWMLVALSSLAWADRLTISNETDQDVNVAVYYVPIFGQVTKASEILTLKPGENNKLDRPARKIGSDRELLIKTDFNFAPTYTKSTFKAAGPMVNIGALQAKRFYIGMQEGQLQGYNEGDWQQRDKTGVVAYTKATATTLLAAAQANFSATYHAIVPDHINEKARNVLLQGAEQFVQSPYDAVVADVRVSNAVSVQEQAALGKRMQKTRAAMESKFGPVARAPKIAVVASGGGYRAMIFTVGFLVGAQKAGFLDMTTWMCGLSGSTWALGCWVENNAKKGRIAPNRFRDQFFAMIKQKTLQTGLTKNDFDQMSSLFLTEILYGKPFTLVNIYGALLANRLFENFGDQKQLLKLSDQQTLINTGDFPVPIYTAVSGEEGQPEYYWYGFTPWEVSMEPWTKNGNGISVPSWGYGRKYRNGKSTEYIPEQSLGFNLGTFGSAFAADVETIYGSIGTNLKNKVVKKVIDKVVISNVGGKRLTWASVPNFGRGVAASPLRANDALQLVDAGLDFNLPYPVVSGMRAERMPDIIIFVDASANIIGSGELKLVEKYARKKGLKFPNIDYNIVSKNAVSIHKENDRSVPVVIYIPRINDANQTNLLNRADLQQYKQLLTGFNVEQCTEKEACNTFNFNYSADDMNKLSGLVEFNVLAYKDEILNVIRERAVGVAQKSTSPSGMQTGQPRIEVQG